MLTVALALGILASPAPGERPTGPGFDTEGLYTVTDTIPDWGNPFGFPFTREEFVRAHLQVRSRTEAEEMARRIYEPDPETIGVTVMDGDLLLLAALSDELGRRVVAYRPRLEELVRLVRADPQRAIDSVRRSKDPGTPE